MDTEQGSSWIKGRVEAAGIGLVTAKTRAFTDLLSAIPEAQEHASVLLIDSLTHFWVELTETYCRKKAAEFRRPTYRLQFQDWAYLKAEWRKFTDLFVNSPTHVIVCGRAGYEYDYIEDEDTKKKQLEKTGIKLKAEGEMGYEPDLLVLMERRMNMESKKDEHIAHVLKDRSAFLDGQEFVEPTFESFLPHVRCLNLGGKQLAVDTSRTSAAAIPAEAPRDKGAIQRQIIIDEINDVLLHHDAAGTGAADRKKRSELMQQHFGTVSKTQIEELLPLSELRAGFDSLHRALTSGKPSRYAVITAKVQIDDALPDHSPAPVPIAVTVAAETIETANGKVVDLATAAAKVEPIPLGEAAAAVVAKVARKSKNPAPVAPDDGIPAFLRRDNPNATAQAPWLGLVQGAWGTD
jgi:hypothetical protein